MFNLITKPQLEEEIKLMRNMSYGQIEDFKKMATMEGKLWESKLNNVIEENKKLHLEITSIKTSVMNSPSSDIKQRLEDLELWRGKVQDLLVGKTPQGKENLTTRGKRILGIVSRN